MPQKFLNVLGMDVAVEQQRGAGMAKVMESSTDGQASALQQGLDERTTIRWDRGVPTVLGNTNL